MKLSSPVRKEVIGFVFSFDELNTNVFYNALLKNFSNRSEIHAVAYTPKGFSCLFFDFDEIIEIPQKYFNNVQYGTKFSDKISPAWIEKSIQLRHSWVLKCIQKFPFLRNQVAKHPRLLSTYRQLGPLYKSGLYNWAKKDYKKRFGKAKRDLTVVSNFLIPDDSATGYIAFPHLLEAYKYLFDQLFIGIKDGLLLKVNKNNSLQTPSKEIALRTRNFKKKATAHNSDFHQTISLAKDILETGATVTNYGAPPLELIELLENKHYSEKYLPSIDDELVSIQRKVILRADAGLFVLYACTDFELCTITPEWSESLGVQLMKARAIRESNNSNDLCFPQYTKDSALKKWLDD